MSEMPKMATGNGPAMISAVVERFKPEDIELLLANRGLPSVGGKEELAERLQQALTEELCEWKWEKGVQPLRSGARACRPRHEGRRLCWDPSLISAQRHTKQLARLVLDLCHCSVP